MSDDTTKIVYIEKEMSFEIREARTFIYMYMMSNDPNHIIRALQLDYNYTVMLAIEFGFYWNIQDERSLVLVQNKPFKLRVA